MSRNKSTPGWLTGLVAGMLLAGCNLPTQPIHVTAPPPPTATAAQTINVDSCGANPMDDLPDSDAIQQCINRAQNGWTITFSSPTHRLGYRGYLVDKTLFLVMNAPRHDLTFTSADPGDHARLRATPALKGFVVRLYARSSLPDAGGVDDINVSHLDLDGGRDSRVCFGPNGEQDGLDDNWGSWVNECTVLGDPWCSAGTLAMAGQLDWADRSQDYAGHPDAWSTGLVVDDVSIADTECGTALGFNGAGGTIRNTIIQTAGDHVHGAGCAQTDPDEAITGWSDGITLTGPGDTVADNTVIDASDVGIVFFGGTNTVISGNTIEATAGNYGMFAGIGIHAWAFGDVSGLQITGNRVTSVADETCGGIHAGINIGPHMWGAGCVDHAGDAAIGNKNCLASPPAPKGAPCPGGAQCQSWAYVAPHKTLTLTGNYVAGAQINYFIEGLGLDGTLVEHDNSSGAPRMTDWTVARSGCNVVAYTAPFGPLDRVAHDPTLAGWVDKRIYCER